MNRDDLEYALSRCETFSEKFLTILIGLPSPWTGATVLVAIALSTIGLFTLLRMF